MRTVLVTGGAGFIGSNFARHWLRAQPQDRVVILDALTYAGNLTTITDIRDRANVRFYPGRIEDLAVVDGVFRAEGVTHVVNFAAESHNDRSMLDPVGFIGANVAGVATLLEAVKRHGCDRMVQVSTDEVYGEIVSGSFVETDPLAPRTPYSAAKAGGELQARAHHIAYGTPVVVTRGSNTFGPYQYPEKLLPFFVTRALRDKKLPVYGAGAQVRDWLHVDDHCAGVAWALQHGVPGESYNIGGGNERTNMEVTSTILETLGKPRTLVKHIGDPRGNAHDKRYALSTRKAEAGGWTPTVDFDRELTATIRWYSANTWWWQPIVDSADYVSFVTRFYGPHLGEDL